MATPRRILIRLPNWLGDALMARPLLHAVRRSAPDAAILAVAPAPLLELLRGEETFDDEVAWSADRAERRGARAQARRWRPDLALVLPPSFSSAWFAWRTGAPERVGFRHQGRTPLLTRALAGVERGERHLSREYLALGAAVGFSEGPLPVLEAPAAARAAAAALLARLVAGAKPALLGPGALFGPAKRWPAERFVELGRTLASGGLPVLVCGTALERELCEAVARSIGGSARSIAGDTDLGTQAALCESAAIVVCNDSGLAHLAGAVGAPTAVVFGSTSSAWSAPLGPRVRVVQHPPVCSPCFQRTCRIGYRCLTAVAVDEVARVCRELAA